MEVYATQSRGIGGKIRHLLDDFVVEELLVDGSLAEVSPPVEVWEPTGEGNYLICVLVKRRWDTFLAVRAGCRETTGLARNGSGLRVSRTPKP